MAENTKIQWTDHTFNGWLGCTRVGAGCLNCYAEYLMDVRYHHAKWGPKGTRSKTKTWGQPKRWNQRALAAGERRKVFSASLSDVFEDWDGSILDSKKRKLWTDGDGHYGPSYMFSRPATMDHLRIDLFKLIDATPMLDWLLLTKRPENIKKMWPGTLMRENVWLGTSVATQKDADEAIPLLAECKHLATYLFLSAEPQIE